MEITEKLEKTSKKNYTNGYTGIYKLAFKIIFITGYFFIINNIEVYVWGSKNIVFNEVPK